MFVRILRGSFLRRRRRKVLAALALALGIGVSTATLSVAVDVGDKVSRELRSFGANIVVQPRADSLPIEMGGVDLRPLSEGGFLSEDHLPRLKTIFWRHHILSFAPFLYQRAVLPDGRDAALVGTWFKRTLEIGDGSSFETGLVALHENWQVEGRWPDALPGDEVSRAGSTVPGAVAGAELAARSNLQVGQSLSLRLPSGEQVPVAITGILRTGGEEDSQLFVPLSWMQEVTGRPGQFRRLQVSALVSPEDEFARQDPSRMTAEEFDRWYCTPYVSSIALQVSEVLPNSEAHVVYRVAQAETAVLSRVERLLALISIAALVGAGLAVLSTMSTTILERRGEIALLKALGSPPALVGSIFVFEAVVLGLLGGAAGYLGGLLGAQAIARSIFGSAAEPSPVLLPAMLGLACLVAVLGTAFPLRSVQQTDPALVLKER